jgi:thiol-disulfide isomerase/thioredoxin
MKFFAFCLLTFYLLISLACRPAAAPVAISNRPVSVNGMPQTNAPLPPPSKPVEEMTWTTFDPATGAEQSWQKLKELQGKAVILDFWATYCPPCIEEIPHLKELQKRYGRENLEVVGLHVGGAEDRPKVAAFVEKLNIDYTVATPEDELTRFIFGSESAIPQTAIFDRRGRLVKKIVGFNPQIQRELDAAVEQAVNSAK